MERTLYTLCIIHTPTHVLLGKKKKGFGMGRWNGFGGKVGEGESIEDAMKREVLEESGLIIGNYTKHGIIEFSLNRGDKILETHIFGTHEFSGDLKETEEMMPAWFSKNEIPFDSMWSDDPLWFPLLFQGKKFSGSFLFDANDQVVSHSLQEVTH